MPPSTNPRDLAIMARYTFKSLDNDIDALNAQLENWGHTPRLQAGQRYGYSALDLATVEQHARHCCERNLETGSPRECLAAAQSYMMTADRPDPTQVALKALPGMIAEADLPTLQAALAAMVKRSQDYAQPSRERNIARLLADVYVAVMK